MSPIFVLAVVALGSAGLLAILTAHEPPRPPSFS